MAVTHYESSYTIRGITYAYGAKFVCYEANKGNGGSEGNGGSAAALTKGETYTFKGYAIDADTGKLTPYPFLIGNSKGETRAWYKENVFPYAKYTISYNANGGKNAPGSKTKTHDTALNLSALTPTREGYTFTGWNTKADGTGTSYAAGASYTANKGTTLYAQWKAKTYTISYNANGGTGAPGSQTKTHGVTLTLTSDEPTRTNYNFVGWGRTAESTSAVYSPGDNYTANSAVTLYAVWELAYQKPRIINVSLCRTLKNADGTFTESDEGNYIRATFTVQCDGQNPVAFFSRKLVTDTVWIDTSEYSITTNSVEVWDFGAGKIDPEKSYDVKITVKDSSGSATIARTITGYKYTIDKKFGGDGVSFGKPAELGAADSLGGKGVAEFAFDGKFNEPVYGKALGMDKLPAIPANSDLDNYMETGCYAVQSNAIAETCSNIPVERAGRLEVWSATGEGVRAAQWSYLRQRYIPYNSSNAVWERDITRNADNVWTYYDWFRSTLTPTASEKVYNKSAITVGLTANITSLTTGSYTKVVFNKKTSSMGDKLSLSEGSVLVGAGVSFVKASAQILHKVLAQGSKHFKISKVSNGTTTHYSWVCQEVDQIKNSSGVAQATGVEFNLMPIIIPVAEGDLITCTYYTSNSTDYIVAGSSTNGYQTYFTVEEL